LGQRKLMIKTKELELTGEWLEWQCTVRTNPPISIFSDIASGDFTRIVQALAKIIKGWNFVDENGDALSPPDFDTINELPLELVTAVANRYVEELTKLPPA
jgi:hypothetical protein